MCNILEKEFRLLISPYLVVVRVISYDLYELVSKVAPGFCMERPGEPMAKWSES